jgi:hypothetical protein
MLHLDVWDRTGEVREFIAQGLTEQWTDWVKGPQTLSDSKKVREYHLDEKKEEALRKIIVKLLDEKVIVRISYAEAKYISPMFVVEKPGRPGEYREIHDLRVVNAWLRSIRYRSDRPDTVQEVAQMGDFATKLDIKGAFQHVMVCKEMRPRENITRIAFFLLGSSFPRGFLRRH